jgi:hypothetical protein
MCTSKGGSCFVWLAISVALAGFMGSRTSARAGSMGILVPAYFYPENGTGPLGTNGWTDMANAARGGASITAIFNPATGPAGSADAGYTAAMTTLEADGGKVVAYIDTDYGAIAQSTVESEIQTYRSQYGNLINGFFFDRMSNDPSEVPYYQSLYSYVKGLSSSYSVIGNPGTATNSSYLAASPPAANTFVTYEGSAANYTSANTSTGSSSLYANIIYDQSSVAGMEADVAFAAQHNVGYIYVTDQPLNPPTGYLYDQLPSYWNQEVTTVASVPEPSVLTNLVSAALFGSLAMTVRWCRRRRRARPSDEASGV